jgi:hypothetical protein
MALIQCYACEREISDEAYACPHCGAPQETLLTNTGCPKCGLLENPEGSLVCVSCGYPLSEDGSGISGPSPTKKDAYGGKMAGYQPFMDPTGYIKLRLARDQCPSCGTWLRGSDECPSQCGWDRYPHVQEKVNPVHVFWFIVCFFVILLGVFG